MLSSVGSCTFPELISYHRPVSTIYHMLSTTKNSSVFTSDMSLLRIKVPFVIGYLRSPFPKEKLPNPLHIRCHPAPSDLNLIHTPLNLLHLSQVTLTQSDSSQATYQTSCQATTVYVMTSFHRNPPSLKFCAAVRDVVSLYG